jgi:hypothetical protein
MMAIVFFYFIVSMEVKGNYACATAALAANLNMLPPLK